MVIKYLSQRDNINLDGTPNHSSQCMISSFTMFYNYLSEKFQFERISELSYLALINANLKPDETRFDWLPHIRTLNKILAGRKINYELQRRLVIESKEKIRSNIDNGFPTVMSIDISSILKNAKGHIVVCVNYDETGYYFHDPYGDARTGYTNTNGENVCYTEELLKKLITNSRNCAILEKINRNEVAGAGHG